MHNAVSNFQSQVEPCFYSLRDFLLAWLDEFLVHAMREDELINIFQQSLGICIKRYLNVSIQKRVFFTLCIRWWGQIIDTNRVRCNTCRLSGLKESDAPILFRNYLNSLTACNRCQTTSRILQQELFHCEVLGEAYALSDKWTPK